MSIVISENMVLAPATNPLNTPIFGWQNLGLAVAATSEADGYPATNVTNPLTHLRWKAAGDGSPEEPPAADQYLTFAIGIEDELDYIAIAGHNLASGQIPVSIEIATALEGSPAELNWTAVISPMILPNDGPAIFRFTPQSIMGIRIRMQQGSAIPYVAVAYVGKLLVAERGTHSDHAPLNLGPDVEVMDGKAERGHFLGRIVLRESSSGAFDLKLLRPDWYRATMAPFIIGARTDPFFFAWKPQDHPGDVVFATLANSPKPVVNFDTGRFAIGLQLNGISVPPS